MKWGTIVVLSIAWIGICFDAVTILLNLSFSFAMDSSYCTAIIWVRYNWFIIFEFFLYLFWLSRIHHTFKFSVFAITFKQNTLIISSIVIGCGVILVLTSLSMNTPEYTELTLSLSADQNGYECVPKWSIGGIITVFIVEQIACLTFNLFFAALFFYKLNKVMMLSLCDFAISDTVTARILVNFHSNYK